MGVNKCRLYTVLREGMGKEVEASAVDGLLRDDVAAVCRQGFDCIGDGSGS